VARWELESLGESGGGNQKRRAEPLLKGGGYVKGGGIPFPL